MAAVNLDDLESPALALPLAVPEAMASLVESVSITPLTNRSIALSWSPLDQGAPFRVYSDMGTGYGIYAYLAQTNEAAFIDEQLRANASYSYRLTLQDDQEEITFAQISAQALGENPLETVPSLNPPSSVVAKPTALPADAILLGLISANDFVDEFKTLSIVGELRNDSGVSVGQTDVTVTFYDSAGTVIGAASGKAMLSAIPPGEKSPFIVSLTKPAGFATYSIRAMGRPVRSQQPAQLAVIEVKRYEDEAGFFHIRGIVENVGTTTAKRTKVAASIYGRDNGVINVGFTYVNPPTLKPGERATFDVIFAYYPRYASQQVIAFED